MLCGLYPSGLIDTANNANHAIWSRLMSMYFNTANSLLLGRRRLPVRRPQSNSWPTLLSRWRRWTERSRRRAALRDLSHDQHLLDDLGITRQEALEEANRPFWE
jgi:uncharacterized protein YjiS (DUF1127 family)